MCELHRWLAQGSWLKAMRMLPVMPSLQVTADNIRAPPCKSGDCGPGQLGMSASACGTGFAGV